MDKPLDFGTGTEGLLRKGAGFVIRSQRICVDVAAGPDAGQTVVLPGPEALVGSGSDADLVLSDPTVSRHHVKIRIERNAVRVTDAGSRNGTVVDGLRILDAYARPDSSIAIGNTTLTLRLSNDTIELPLSSDNKFGALLGGSVAMRQLFAVLERVAATETTVLIEGETGTGKELVAEAIHEGSSRANGPFIVFDCSAVSSQLIESELFGHVKGAFTGALSDRVGAFEAAHGGTLFLDEIGELPLDLQPKLLRALERLQIRRVGTHEARPVDVRIISATNRSLANEVERETFREDLYYRLAVVRVSAPPLRERLQDVPMLVAHFVDQFAGRHGNAPSLPERVIEGFQAMSWPGNVRELRNAVARALSVGPPRDLRTSAEIAAAVPLPAVAEVDLSKPLRAAKDEVASAFERAYLVELLKTSGGVVTRAAEIAGTNRKYLQRAMLRHGLRGGDGQADG